MCFERLLDFTRVKFHQNPGVVLANAVSGAPRLDDAEVWVDSTSCLRLCIVRGKHREMVVRSVQSSGKAGSRLVWQSQVKLIEIGMKPRRHAKHGGWMRRSANYPCLVRAHRVCCPGLYGLCYVGRRHCRLMTHVHGLPPSKPSNYLQYSVPS